MMLALGIAVLGCAHVLSGRMTRGLVIAGFGMYLAALVRPHMAGIVAISLAVAYLIRRPKPGLRQVGPLLKVVGVVVLGALAVMLVLRTDEFLDESGVGSEKGVGGVLTNVNDRTAQGGSEFVPSIVQSPATAPIAAVTVLFRPFPYEANNTNALIASSESVFLMVLLLLRLRWVARALGSIRRQAYVAFALAYTGLFVIAFSGVANFGLLSRQRVQVLPVALLFLTMATRDRSEEPAPVEATEERI